jgi:hypothetical protein
MAANLVFDIAENGWNAAHGRPSESSPSRRPPRWISSKRRSASRSNGCARPGDRILR